MMERLEKICIVVSVLFEGQEGERQGKKKARCQNDVFEKGSARQADTRGTH
jgi:hypothetical protein